MAPNEPIHTAPERYTDAWVDDVVRYHQPDEKAIGQITEIRSYAAAFLKAIIANCPNSADRTTAIQHVRDAMMRANASIVLRGLV